MIKVHTTEKPFRNSNSKMIIYKQQYESAEKLSKQ